MSVNFKIVTMVIAFCFLLSSTNDGAEIGEISISDGSFRPKVMEAIKDSNLKIEPDDSFTALQLLKSRLENLLPFSSNNTFISSNNTLEQEWVTSRIDALKRMIHIYTNDATNVHEKQTAINNLQDEIFHEQWPLIQKSIRSQALKNHLSKLYLIRQQQRDSMQISEELTLKEKDALTKFFNWFDFEAKSDALAQAELVALDKIGILPAEEIELLKRENYCSEPRPEAMPSHDEVNQ